MIQVKNSADKTQIQIKGDIVSDEWKDWAWDDEIYPDEIRNLLKDAKGEVEVTINSNGGNLFAGVAISNILSRYEGKTKCVIEGVAASAASVVAFGCDEIEIPANAYLMIHKPLVSIYGNADDLLNMADTLDSLQEGIVNTYLTKSKVDKEVINDLVNNETWLTGEKASEFFDVKVTNLPTVLNYSNTLQSYTNTPGVLLKHKEDEIFEKLKMY